MLLIFISLITGYIGFSIGGTINAEGILGFVGFLCPTLFVIQRIYTNLAISENDGYEETGEYEE